jgi:Icc-related predicted phosphoesterase
MIIAHFSDLHCNRPHLRWITKNATQFDAIAISGDLLNAAQPTEIYRQIGYLRHWAATLEKTGVPTLISSGNHDFNDAVLDLHIPNQKNRLPKKITSAPQWMRHLESAHITTDQQHRLISAKTGPVLFTTLPCAMINVEAAITTAENLMRSGDYLRQLHRCPWIVLSHIPPYGATCGEPENGDLLLAEWISRYQPQYVLCGHMHASPYKKGHNFHDTLEATTVLNPGRPSKKNPIPNHISINISTGKLTWFKST